MAEETPRATTRQAAPGAAGGIPAPRQAAGARGVPGARRTGPKPTFSERELIDAALRAGIDRFTLKTVAADLGTSVPALYRLIRNRDDLVSLCLAHVASTFDLPRSADTWQALIRDYVDAMWDGFERYPGLPTVLFDHPGAHLHVQGQMRDFVDGLARAGIPGGAEAAEFIADFVGDVTIMTHIGVSQMRDTMESGETGLERAQRTIAAHAEETGRQPVLPPDESWAERGLLDRKVAFIIEAVERGVRG
jgi:AcrR family transcriptional regulator